MKILSIWDTRLASDMNVEAWMLERGHQLKSQVRLLIEDSTTLPHWIGAQSRKDINYLDTDNILRKFVRLASHIRFNISINKKYMKNFDVIICHFGQTGARFLKKCSNAGIPLVVIFYGHDASAALKSRRWRRKYRDYIKYDCKFIVMCEEVSNRLIKFGINPNRIVSWNIPLKFSSFMKTNSEEIIENVNILTIGRFMPKKGHENIFASMVELRNLGIKSHLNIVGYGGGLEYYKDLARQLNLENQISWYVGYTGTKFEELVDELVIQSHIFVFAGEASNNGDDEGGAPLSIIRAQAASIPIISSYFAGIETTLEHGKTGFYIEQPIVSNLTKIVLDFKKCPVKYFQVAPLGAKKARFEFDYLTQMYKIEKILEKVIQKN